MNKTVNYIKPVSLILLSCAFCCAQTFEINGQPPQTTQQNSKTKSKSAAKASPAQNALGWGTSIDVARQSRAAEDALKRGDTAAAFNYAQNAANAAPQNARLWFLLGYTARLSGHYAASVQAFQRGLNTEPGSIEGLSGLAQTYARMGRFDEAKQLLMRLIAADPRRSPELIMAGELFLRAGNYQQAIDLLSRAENIKPASRSELLIASAYQRLKQPERAKEFLQLAVRRDPNNRETQRALAGFYRESEDYPAAIAILNKISGTNPDLLAELAYTYELAKDSKRSANAYVRAANGAPKNIAYQLSAAQALVRINDFDKAQGFLARAKSIDPNHYRLHATLAEIARLESRSSDAINEYRLALSTAPEVAPEGPLYSIQLRMNLSELLRDAGEDAAAREQATIADSAINTLQVEDTAKFDYFRLRASIQSALGNLGAAENYIKQALAIDAANPNILLQYGQLLWKMERRKEARDVYAKVLTLDPNNKFALSSLGFLAREMNDAKQAEAYFTRMTQLYPNEYAAYLALGDLYTALRNFPPAEVNYQKAYKLNQKHPMIIAGGANAGIESKKFDRAKMWLDRATPSMSEHPFVMRERERYLTWTGNYLESAKLGYKTIEKLPRDRDAVVYLGYDLLFLGRYDDLLRLTSKYEPILNKDAALPLLAGYVQRRSELLDEAERAFSRSIERDPRVPTAYVNRGYVYNDLQNPEMAAKDFNSALKLEPQNGEANLGLAFSYLQLRKPDLVLNHVEKAAATLGESKSTHLARGGGFREKLLLAKAEKEYREALKFEPDNSELNMALAQVLFGQKHYAEALTQYQQLLPLAEDDSFIYANMASAAAKLHREPDALRYVTAAERNGGDQAAVLLATGDTLLELGHNDAALQRYQQALTAPDNNRVDVRLAFARTFLRQGKWDDARQQVALAFAESRVGEGSAVTPEDLVTAAGIFLGMNDFDLARRYYEMAQTAGADAHPVAIGLTNTYLAQGNYSKAKAELEQLGSYSDNASDFDYMMAYGTLNRQHRNNSEAILGFAHAHEISEDDENAQRALLDVAGEEGTRFGQRFSLSSDTLVNGIFEDATVYELDAKQLGVTSPALLPTPRSSLEIRSLNDVRFHFKNAPALIGTYEFRNAHGQISYPSESVILNENTYDTVFGFGVNPALHLGKSAIYLTPGIQFTIRRDTNVPVQLDQNLFREQLYLQTTPFFNWISVNGYAIHESGNFTEQNQTSKDNIAQLEFVVGRPWGKNALITGYHVRDLQLSPTIQEYFTTSTYAGYQRRFSNNFKAAFLGEYIRSWRVQNIQFAIAQAMRPAVRFDYQRKRWSGEGYFAFTRGEGFHDYDNAQSSFFITYTKPLRRRWNDSLGEVGVQYPLRFSFGLQQQSFFNFPGQKKNQFRPVLRLTVF